MKAFRFPLQVVRTLREHKERNALERYAQALRGAEEAARHVNSNQTEINSCWALLQELLSAGVPSDQVGRVQSYSQFLLERHQELLRNQRAAEERAQKAWDELRVAMRDREAIEKHHVKQRRAYDLEYQREEQKQLDEMASRLAGLTEAWRA